MQLGFDCFCRGKPNQTLVGLVAIDQYRNQDLEAKRLLDPICSSLGMAIVNIAALLDVEAVVISGGLGVSLGNVFQEKWEEMLKKHVPFPPGLRLSELDNQEGVWGAVYTGIEFLHQSMER